jgi:hypothetical protein
VKLEIIPHAPVSMLGQVFHSFACLSTGAQPLPKLVLHRVRSSAASFYFQYPVFSSGLLLPPNLPVTSTLPLSVLP